MKRIFLLSTALIALLILPGIASANHFNNVEIDADCTGFNAQLEIHFASHSHSLELHFEVSVLDMDGIEVESRTGDMTVTRDDVLDVSVQVSDEFTTEFDGEFLVSGTITISPYQDGITHFENSIECGTVANDNIRLENIKASYR